MTMEYEDSPDRENDIMQAMEDARQEEESSSALASSPPASLFSTLALIEKIEAAIFGWHTDDPEDPQMVVLRIVQKAKADLLASPPAQLTSELLRAAFDAGQEAAVGREQACSGAEMRANDEDVAFARFMATAGVASPPASAPQGDTHDTTISRASQEPSGS